MKDDTISRKAAIDALADMHCKSDEDGYVWIIRSDAWARIDALPSAQPEERTQKRTETHACDLISRQAAIESIRECAEAAHDNHEWDMEQGYLNAIECIEEEPSAQPEPIRINLNETIKVKLTDLGKKIYYHQHDRTNQIAGIKICEPKFPKEDENGYTEIQLWVFIELYGEHIGMTLPNVIKPNEIVYER